MKINRQLLTKLHLVAAILVLPALLLFCATGLLYTWGIKGTFETTVQKIQLEHPLKAELPALLNIVEQTLKEQNLPQPTGAARIKTLGDSFQLEWQGARQAIILEPTGNPNVAKLKIKQANWHRHFVQLHKAKGGIAFKIYASALTLGLLLIFISGYIMAWQIPKLRKTTALSTILGIAIFIAAVALS